jgi:hypothetical protein
MKREAEAMSAMSNKKSHNDMHFDMIRHANALNG